MDRPPSSTVEQSLKEKNTFITPLSVHIQFRPPNNDEEEKQKNICMPVQVLQSCIVIHVNSVAIFDILQLVRRNM